uniref:superoxide dismutase n=1 Tax=Elaeophora elaphi TaxID=1147741 RepID=A0A0R3RW86_9BILA
MSYTNFSYFATISADNKFKALYICMSALAHRLLRAYPPLIRFFYRSLMNLIIGIADRLLLGKNYGSSLRRLKHTLPDLPYDYGALEPVVSAEIMQVHHGKHHAAYVNALNLAEEKVKEALAKGNMQAAVAGTKLMNFNAGGHINHSFFWEGLTAVKDSGEPNSELMAAIKKDFGSLEAMKERLSAKTIAIQGSGWGWLAYDKEMKRLQLACCPNQDLLEPTTGLIPLFCIDVWEHAYYLQYKNIRPDFVKAVWKIANWKIISDRYIKAKR